MEILTLFALLGLDIRAAGRLEFFLSHRLVERLLNHFTQHFLTNALAIAALEHLHRYFTRAEAVDTGGTRSLF